MAYFKQLKTKYWQVQIRRYGVKPETKTFPTREEKLKYISECMSEERRNAMADELTIMDVEYIDALNAATKEDLG